ncbi:hypothetical protein GQ457_02G039880 [Hibiscus cannabinus]
MSLKQSKVSLQDPAYRYPSISTGTRVLTNISVITGPSVPIPKRQYRYPRYRYLNPRTDTPSIFLSLRIPVAKLSTDTLGGVLLPEYRVPIPYALNAQRLVYFVGEYRYPLHQ